jgi:superfamily II DNA or RNA helicase
VIASSIYDEGVDIPKLRELFLACGGKSAIKIIQRVGRLLRPHPDKNYAIIHDFVDNDGKWLMRQSTERHKMLSNEFEVEDV